MKEEELTLRLREVKWRKSGEVKPETKGHLESGEE